jgi:hypothetical protein
MVVVSVTPGYYLVPAFMGVGRPDSCSALIPTPS